MISAQRSLTFDLHYKHMVKHGPASSARVPTHVQVFIRQILQNGERLPFIVHKTQRMYMNCVHVLQNIYNPVVIYFVFFFNKDVLRQSKG